jgi:hypothetical protein
MNIQESYPFICGYLHTFHSKREIFHESIMILLRDIFSKIPIHFTEDVFPLLRKIPIWLLEKNSIQIKDKNLL